jgi:hypothetical protein
VGGAVLAVVLKTITISIFDVGREGGAVTYAVNTLARVTLVCVLAQIIALCDLERLGGDNLVERVGGARELFAGVAVAVCC